MRTYAPVRRLLAAALPPLSRRARAASATSTVSGPVPASTGAGLAAAIARGDACTARVRAASWLHSHATQRIRSSAPVNTLDT